MIWVKSFVTRENVELGILLWQLGSSVLKRGLAESSWSREKQSCHPPSLYFAKWLRWSSCSAKQLVWVVRLYTTQCIIYTTGYTTVHNIHPLSRGWAEQKQRISIPVPALPVQEFWQEKSRKICNSLNWFKGVTFTFWIKMHRKNIFPKISSKNYKFSGSFPATYPVSALPRPEYKFLFPVPLNP